MTWRYDLNSLNCQANFRDIKFLSILTYYYLLFYQFGISKFESERVINQDRRDMMSIVCTEPIYILRVGGMC